MPETNNVPQPPESEHSSGYKQKIQENISVGCIPPACQPYPVVSQVPRPRRGGVGTHPLDTSTPLPTYPKKEPHTRDTRPHGKDMGPEIPTPCEQTGICGNITITKLREGNVFSRLCLSTGLYRLRPQSSLCVGPTPRTCSNLFIM